MGSNLPIVLIEVLLIFGGVLAFGWWQLRSIEHDRREAAQRRKAEADADADADARAGDAAAAPAPAGPPERESRH